MPRQFAVATERVGGVESAERELPEARAALARRIGLPEDAPALALQMGNSPDVIFRHYRELVKPKDAARYWQIKPSASAGKIVSMRA